MSYSLSELLTLFRQQVEDLEQPYLGSDGELYGYLDEAQKEFARGTDLFVGKRARTLAAGSLYTSPVLTRMTKIKRVTLRSTGRKLKIRTIAQMDDEFMVDDYGNNYGDTSSANWETLEGTPRYVVLDEDPKNLRAVPSIPATGTDDTVDIYGFRYPDTDIVDATSVLEVTKRHHQRALVVGMKAQAYDKQDAEVNNSKLADKFDREFRFRLEKIKRDLRRRRSPAGTVRYGGL